MLQLLVAAVCVAALAGHTTAFKDCCPHDSEGRPDMTSFSCQQSGNPPCTDDVQGFVPEFSNEAAESARAQYLAHEINRMKHGTAKVRCSFMVRSGTADFPAKVIRNGDDFTIKVFAGVPEYSETNDQALLDETLTLRHTLSIPSLAIMPNSFGGATLTGDKIKFDRRPVLDMDDSSEFGVMNIVERPGGRYEMRLSADASVSVGGSKCNNKARVNPICRNQIIRVEAPTTSPLATPPPTTQNP